ncbi:MAG: hypothetical protein SFW65_00540 [Alphaproteobacteria bacterium]|nr:hypothetical protein [Alphaproteobacteria bacterium]
MAKNNPKNLHEALHEFLRREHPDFNPKLPYTDEPNNSILREVELRILPSRMKNEALIGGHEIIAAILRGRYLHVDLPVGQMPMQDETNPAHKTIAKYLRRYFARHAKITHSQTLRAALLQRLQARCKLQGVVWKTEIAKFIHGEQPHIALQEAIDEITHSISMKAGGKENYLRSILRPGKTGNVPMPFSKTHLRRYTARRHSKLVRSIRPDLPRTFKQALKL